MCDFPEFTLKSALNDLARWVGFNYFFWLLGLTSFLWFTQKYYRGLKSDRGYFPSVYTRILVEFILLNATAMAAWISHTCKNWDHADGIIVHLIYCFWLFSFAFQLAALMGPRWLGVAAFATALSAVLSLVNVILCIVFVWNIWSLFIYVATTGYLTYMALNLIVAVVWPDKGSRNVIAIIREFANAWDIGLACHAKVCVRAIEHTAKGTSAIVSNTEINDAEISESEISDNDDSDYAEEESDASKLPTQAPTASRMSNRRPTNQIEEDDGTNFKLS